MDSKPIGYSDPKTLIPVYELTKEQLDYKQKIADLWEAVKLGEEAESLMRKLQDNCKHTVFYDIAGMPVDLRYCKICECFMYTV